jgi:hypothetical protein
MLSGFGISDEGLNHLSGLAHLEQLILNCPEISDAGLRYLSKLTKLKELMLLESNITDAGLQHLATLADTQKLSLRNTKVRGSGLAYLANGVTRATRIAKLASGTMIRVEVIGKIRRAFGSLPTIGDLLP